MTKYALVCGAGGFIGGHLVKRLKNDGFWVRGVDLNQSRRFRGRRSAGPGVLSRHCRSPLRRGHLRQMGGAGYIFTGEYDADVMHNSAAIKLNVLGAYHWP